MREQFESGDNMDYDPHLEARVASLETAMDFVVDAIKEMSSEMKDLRKDLRAELNGLRVDMRSDFRILFGAIITLGIGEAGLLARAFGWI